jgi:hypothetical protein
MGIAIDRSTPGGRLLARTVLRGHGSRDRQRRCVHQGS